MKLFSYSRVFCKVCVCVFGKEAHASKTVYIWTTKLGSAFFKQTFPKRDPAWLKTRLAQVEEPVEL